MLSNLPFALIGLWALWASRGLPARGVAGAWTVFALALVCTAAGSAVYHWAPHNASLAFDRLPIAWACAALLCAFLAERVDPRWARPAVLATALAGGQRRRWRCGGGAKRPAAATCAPTSSCSSCRCCWCRPALLMRLPPRTPRAVPGSAWWTVLGRLRAAPRPSSWPTTAVLEQLGFVSGHTLKHLLAAAAAGWLLRAALAARADQLR